MSPLFVGKTKYLKLNTYKEKWFIELTVLEIESLTFKVNISSASGKSPFCG
jgi:hypothetical protein